ncbi:hypothetical protein NEF87_003480 [Candidatus Lokiarchaeum ossiferum]|uniref:Uncharacterized protein n=1 Tax=Candidatus Lokiarchaeum ossiferum TaxID=2951803 RepID=A0ABY6HUU5_9ARCH|nr:hypothetical protein NEF87_003480 [Candidatus Lokiarchaeum sp. B-35]
MQKPKSIIFNPRGKVIILSIISFAILGSLIQPTLVCAAEEVSMSISKTMGSDFGQKINGKFRIRGTGSAGITSLDLYFNGTLVANEDTNALDFNFDTDDYSLGMMNITLIGKDASGNIYSDQKDKEFVSSAINLILIPIFLLAIGGTIGAKYYQNKKQNKKKEVNLDKTKQNVKIKIDKDFM